MAHVFLSYSRKDTDFMRQLRADLRDEGLDVWTDETGLEPGTPDWERAIAEEIKRADCMVVILSPDAAQSKWVAIETAYAEQRGLRIFPVLARGDPLDAVPFRLTNYQWIDARRAYDSALRRLTPAVCRLVGIESRSEQQQREEEARRLQEEAEAERQRLEAIEQERQAALERDRKAREITAPAGSRPSEAPDPLASAPEAEVVAAPPRGGINPLLIGGGVAAVAVLVGIMALAGVFGGGATTAQEEAPPTEQAALAEEKETPATEEIVPVEETPPTEEVTPLPTAPTEEEMVEEEKSLAEQPLPPCELGYSADCPVTSNDQWTPVIEEFDGVEMALVPAGCFMMGSESRHSDEQPIHEQCFDVPFWIEEYEVTNEQFAAFLNEAGNQTEGGATWLDAEAEDVRIDRQTGDTWTPQDGFADHPAVEITWFGAVAYCESRGARLPTEAEWEYAARGPDSLVYSWGNTFIPNNVTYEGNSSRPTKVGSRPGGMSWVGALDMTGNVWEWVSSTLRGYPYSAGDGREVDGSNDSESSRGLRGGSWYDGLDNLRAARRSWGVTDGSSFSVGVRCARSY